jgi:hypothetical protein
MILSSAQRQLWPAGPIKERPLVYAMVTSGEAGIDGMDPEEARSVREAEQVESAGSSALTPWTSSGWPMAYSNTASGCVAPSAQPYAPPT